jgi:hypothetical protein
MSANKHICPPARRVGYHSQTALQFAAATFRKLREPHTHRANDVDLCFGNDLLNKPGIIT